MNTLDYYLDMFYYILGFNTSMYCLSQKYDCELDRIDARSSGGICVFIELLSAPDNNPIDCMLIYCISLIHWLRTTKLHPMR